MCWQQTLGVRTGVRVARSSTMEARASADGSVTVGTFQTCVP